MGRAITITTVAVGDDGWTWTYRIDDGEIREGRVLVDATESDAGADAIDAAKAEIRLLG